jgi:hypothetical protein
MVGRGSRGVPRPRCAGSAAGYPFCAPGISLFLERVARKGSHRSRTS